TEVVWSVSPGNVASIGSNGVLSITGEGVVTVMVSSVSNPSLSETYVLTVSSGITAVKRMRGYGIEVYPNPALDVLNIDASIAAEALCDVRIYDAMGREVWQSGSLESYTMEVNLSGWNKGIYHIKFNLCNATKVVKFVKE
ncbi:MAG: T9SS type A sorting domain-containing protein, partial [Cytophagales bacterium]|nr:T9SS type A sorting domain-containing protein [Cytophagales bacterium]